MWYPPSEELQKWKGTVPSSQKWENTHILDKVSLRKYLWILAQLRARNVMLCIMFSLSVCHLKNYIYEVWEYLLLIHISSVQFSHSVMSKSLWPMDCSKPGFPVHQQVLELAQTHVHWVGDAIQSSHSCHPLLLPSILPSIRVFSVSQFFASGGQSIGISASASVLPMNIQDWFLLGLITQNKLKI